MRGNNKSKKDFPKRGLRIIFTCLLFLSLNPIVYPQWILQYASDSSSFNEIQFVDNNNGFVVGGNSHTLDKVFLNTTNGGISWNDLSINIPYNYEIFDLSFINSQTGYVCGRAGAFIFKTTNSGLQWQTISISYFGNQTWNAIQFINENTGYIAGRYGMRAKTLDGGINWLFFDTTYRNIYDVFFFNENTGFMADGQGYVQKTTNGGISWNTIRLLDTLNAVYSLQKIAFQNQSVGFIVGQNTINGAVFKTTNSGESWKNILISPITLSSVDVENDIVYVGGQSNKLLKSTNSGFTWIQQLISATNYGIYSIYLITSNEGYLTINHNIYKTTNGGVGINKLSSEIQKNFNLFQNYPNPTNNNSKVKFTVIHESFIDISLYDISGKKIRNYINTRLSSGLYDLDIDMNYYPSSIYFLIMKANDFTQSIKIILSK